MSNELTRRSLALVLLAMGVIVLSALAAQAQNACAYPNLVEWPTRNVVWKLCWVAPPNSAGPNASGLELQSVYYKGKLMLARANIPLLNVKYDRGDCGGPHHTYRDWMGDFQAFSVDGIIEPGYAEPTVPPRTACDRRGRDSGSFKGVAVEKRPDKLVLTTQIKSAWYRYIQTWTFLLDGTIEPRISFNAIDNFCTANPHTHHAYWRFDFDVDDPSNDLIEEYNSGEWSPLDETERQKDDANGRKWRVRDTRSKGGVEIIPGANDNQVDDFGVADVWALAYDRNQLDDGGALRGPNGDQPQLDKYLDNEKISDGKHNVVLWYRGGVYHRGDKNSCSTVGPTLRWVQPSRKGRGSKKQLGTHGLFKRAFPDRHQSLTIVTACDLRKLVFFRHQLKPETIVGNAPHCQLTIN